MLLEETVSGGHRKSGHIGVGGQLLSLFCELFGVASESVHPELQPRDIEQWDSIGHMALVAAIEQTFSICLDVEEIIEMTSFGAIQAVIEKRIN